MHLIDFPEPFGLSVIESLATGTPVIAAPYGSMPELISDGVTGFLVDDLDGRGRRSGTASTTLDRTACRDDVELRFTAERMVDDYAAPLRPRSPPGRLPVGPRVSQPPDHPSPGEFTARFLCRSHRPRLLGGLR